MGRKQSLKVSNHAEIQDRMDYRIPYPMYWTINQVGEWIVGIGFPRYQDCFVTNRIDGRKLITINGSTLPQIGIYDYEHIKEISRKIQELIEVETIPWERPIALPPREDLGMYMETKSWNGENRERLTFSKFLEDKDKKWKPPLGNMGLLLHPVKPEPEIDFTPKSSRFSQLSQASRRSTTSLSAVSRRSNANLTQSARKSSITTVTQSPKR